MSAQTVDSKVATAQTVDATQTTIATVSIPASSVTVIEANVQALKSDGTTAKAWKFWVEVRDNAGVSAIVGALASLLTAQGDAGAATWDATATLAGTTLSIKVTGAVATTVNWSAHYSVRVHTP